MPLEIAPNFPPYKHQFEAFKRLHTQDNHIPQPTLLTTGTGSGKTGSFLIPLIEKLKFHSSTIGARALILSPTRELVKQTLDFCYKLSIFTNQNYTHDIFFYIK